MTSEDAAFCRLQNAIKSQECVIGVIGLGEFQKLFVSSFLLSWSWFNSIVLCVVSYYQEPLRQSIRTGYVGLPVCHTLITAGYTVRASMLIRRKSQS